MSTVQGVLHHYGFHMAHVTTTSVAFIVVMSGLEVEVHTGTNNCRNGDLLLRHFVDVIWVGVFITLYLVPVMTIRSEFESTHSR